MVGGIGALRPSRA